MRAAGILNWHLQQEQITVLHVVLTLPHPTSFSVNTSMKVVVPLQWLQEGLMPELRRVGLSGYL
jgi:hypothetical protein